MSQLTTFSKLLIVIGLVTLCSVAIITCNNCTQNNQPQQVVYTQPSQPVQASQPYVDYGQYQVVGPDQVVVVYDSWSGSQFYLSYATWQYLGGYNAAVDYYRKNRYDPVWVGNQNVYKYQVETEINNYYAQSGSTEKYDPNTPLVEKIKYQKSTGFSNPTVTDKSGATVTTGQKSTGFSGSQSKWFNTPDVEETKADYKPSTGFTTKQPETAYKPSTGFSKPTATEQQKTGYKPSTGFKSSGDSPKPSTYKPSTGFSTQKPQPPKQDYKPSTGFGKPKN